MKLIDLLRMSNARLYALEIYGESGGRTCRASMEFDMENVVDKMKLTRYAGSEVVRFQPIITDKGAALEVELYV